MELSVLANKVSDKTEHFLLSQLVLDNSSEGFRSVLHIPDALSSEFLIVFVLPVLYACVVCVACGCACVCAYACLGISVCMCACMYMFMCVHAYMCMCVDNMCVCASGELFV